MKFIKKLRVFGKNNMLLNLAKNDFVNKYSGSALGIFWGFVPAFVTVLVYWFVFNIGFKIQPMGNVPYLIWLVSGLIPWLFFSDGITAVTNCFVEYSYLVKKVVFNIEIIPLVKVVSSLFVHIFFVILLLYITLMYGYIPDIYFLQLLYYIFALTIFIISLGTITSTINVFLKDIGHLVSVILQFGIWLIPVLWDASMFNEKLIIILKINPLYYIIQGYRDSLVYKIPLTERIYDTIYFWSFILIISIIGKYIYRKMRIHFADLL